MPKRQRKKRKKIRESVLKSALAKRFEKKWGQYEFENNIKIVYPNEGKNIICPYSSFYEENSKWFWGIPKKNWDNWGDNDYLVLILENEIEGFSMILFTPNESKALLRKCGIQKENKNKLINLRIYKEDDIVKFQEDKKFDVNKRIRSLKKSIEYWILNN